MTRIFVHAGFHKTGTKTVQQFLQQNGPILWPRTALVLPARLREVTTRLGFWYQDLPEPEMLDRWQAAMETFLRGLDLAPGKAGKPGRALIISAENMIGRMPDGSDPQPYPVAVDLLQRLLRALQVLPQPGEVTLYLSLRPHQQWLRSIHSHKALKDPGLRDDLDRFCERFGASSITEEAQRIAAALPETQVITRDIQTLAGAPFGIAQPFVDFLDLPPDALAQLTPPGHVYRSADPALVGQLIALNRSGLNREALAAARQRLIHGNELAGTDLSGKPR
ncbi:hypothetical protein [Paracoccus xiamenensis]|uniref:hypothetical protein n=1 Tax=Paracoccus xiamenensis TaxID=2714901 RepID=UPI00140B62DB|nr:hypothetical protein [Paracoccus xiamenensis]NHF72633.1 hypothetical protein [Paracoccus xiamenensis]